MICPLRRRRLCVILDITRDLGSPHKRLHRSYLDEEAVGLDDGDLGVYDFAFERFPDDGAVVDAEFGVPVGGHDFANAVVAVLRVEDADYKVVACQLAFACASVLMTLNL